MTKVKIYVFSYHRFVFIYQYLYHLHQFPCSAVKLQILTVFYCYMFVYKASIQYLLYLIFPMFTRLSCFETKLPNLTLKTRPKQLLGSLPLDIVLRGFPSKSWRQNSTTVFPRQKSKIENQNDAVFVGIIDCAFSLFLKIKIRFKRYRIIYIYLSLLV